MVIVVFIVVFIVVVFVVVFCNDVAAVFVVCCRRHRLFHCLYYN